MKKKNEEKGTVFVPINASNIGRLVGKAGANVKRIEKETGARVYWQDANASSTRITTDRKKLAELNAILQ